MNRNIVIVAEGLGSGGAERQLVGLAHYLKNSNFKVFIVYYVDEDFYLDDLLQNDIKCILCEKARSRWLRPFYIKRILDIIKPVSVLSFLPGPNYAMGIISLLCKTNYKIIMSERSHTNSWSIRTRLLFRLYSTCDYLVTNSYSEANNIKENCTFLRNKIRTITNFVDSDNFKPTNYNKENKLFTIICVGRIRYYKNVLRFLDALFILKQNKIKLKVKWFGRGYEDEYEKAVNQKFCDLNLKDVIEFYPATKNIAEEYNKADAFCLPSIIEGYPNVVIEAMSCGLPILCSNICENPYIVNSSNGILFDPYNPTEIANAIEKMIRMKEYERITIGKNNRTKVLKENTLKEFGEKFINLLT